MSDTRGPNVLVVITDQQRADHVGFAGNPTVRTPHLDAVAERGTVFENAWVNNPVCMPNRSTIMTGRMPSAHGVIFNDRSLEWTANTFVRQFRSAGYRTALIGKSHLQHGPSRNAVRDQERAGAIEDPYPAGWNTLEDFERYLDGTAPDVPDGSDGSFYGFDTVEFAIDHGARVTGHHLLWALERGGSEEELLTPLTEEAPGTDRHPDWWQVYRAPYGPEFHSTTFVTERTCAFIEDAAAADEPWVAWTSFPDPHHPMCPPGEWFDRHDPADIEVPASFDDSLEHAPRHLQRFARVHPSKQLFWVAPCGAGGDRDLIRHAIAATYGMIEMIDDGVGRILATLDRLGQLDDTIIVFTSDHGDMMGDHGLFLKGWMPYRGTMQVPLVVAAPGFDPARTTSLAASMDIGPTLLDLAGLDDFDGIQGTSLRPILEAPADSVRDHVLVEEDVPSGFRGGLIPDHVRTVITDDGMKYTRLSTGEDQLFDLVADPDEMTQLAPVDPARRATAIERLADAMMRADDVFRGAPVAG